MKTGPIYRDEARGFSDAHADGLHDEAPRQFCPECEGRELSSYPVRPTDGRSEALREFESACNTIALVFPGDSPQRRIVLQARGDMREANGEART